LELALREKIGPSHASQCIRNCSKVNHLRNGSIDDGSARDRSLTAVKERIFLNPIYEQKTDQSKDRQNGLQRNEKGGKDEKIDDIDVLIPYLKLQLLVHFIDFELMQP
jgi:hypothetical protein